MDRRAAFRDCMRRVPALIDALLDWHGQPLQLLRIAGGRGASAGASAHLALIRDIVRGDLTP